MILEGYVVMRHIRINPFSPISYQHLTSPYIAQKKEKNCEMKKKMRKMRKMRIDQTKKAPED